MRALTAFFRNLRWFCVVGLLSIVGTAAVVFDLGPIYLGIPELSGVKSSHTCKYFALACLRGRQHSLQALWSDPSFHSDHPALI